MKQKFGKFWFKLTTSLLSSLVFLLFFGSILYLYRCTNRKQGNAAMSFFVFTIHGLRVSLAILRARPIPWRQGHETKFDWPSSRIG